MKIGRLRIRGWTWAHRATALVFIVLLIMGARSDFPWFKGLVTATTLFAVIPCVDPLAALEVFLASGTADTTMLFGTGLLVLLGLIMGPVFCGWICPLGFLLDLNGVVRAVLEKTLARLGIGLPRFGIWREARFGVLGLVLGFSLIAGLPAFQIVSPINFMSWSLVFFAGPALAADAGLWERITSALRAAAAAGGYLFTFLVLIMVVEYAAPRIWCRAICPLGALYSMIGRRAPFRIRVNTLEAGRSPCGRCTARCPMGIDVIEDYTLPRKKAVDHPDCTRCGECIDVCQRKVLRLGFRDRRHDKTGGTGK